jgi:hypothetical protein
MSWFRANRGVAAWLAFFALACQLTLTFGHIHIGKFSSGLVLHAVAQTTDAQGDEPPSPQNSPAAPSVDFCAVCANIGLAGSLILPILLLILTPELFTKVLRWSLTAHEPDAFDHLPFRARGPPLA